MIPAWINKRLFDDTYLQRWRNLLPGQVLDAIFKHHIESKWDYTTLGIRTHKHHRTVRPFINDIVPTKIVNGDIAIKSGIENFQRSKVTFVDGSAIDDVNCVIFATGYTVKFPFFKKDFMRGK